MKTILSLLITIHLSHYAYSKPTLQEVYDYMVEKECIYPDVHLRVIVLETGWLKYGGNNLCAWRSGVEYWSFGTWQESIDHLKWWQDTYFPVHMEQEHDSTDCDYYHFLRWKGYKTGKKYHPKEIGYTNYLKKIVIYFLDGKAGKTSG